MDIFIKAILQYIEEPQLFPDCIIGFRQGLTIQGAFLQLKPDTIHNDDEHDQMILALDLKANSDNVSYDVIFKVDEEIQCEERT